MLYYVHLYNVGLAKIRSEAIKKRYREKQLAAKARGEEADLSSSSSPSTSDSNNTDSDREEEKEEELEGEELHKEDIEERREHILQEQINDIQHEAIEVPPLLEDIPKEEIPCIRPIDVVPSESTHQTEGLFSSDKPNRKPYEERLTIIEQVGKGLESLEIIQHLNDSMYMYIKFT